MVYGLTTFMICRSTSEASTRLRCSTWALMRLIFNPSSFMNRLGKSTIRGSLDGRYGRTLSNGLGSGSDLLILRPNISTLFLAEDLGMGSLPRIIIDSPRSMHHLP